MSTVERDLARYERQVACDDAMEASRERAIEAQAEDLKTWTVAEVLTQFSQVHGYSKALLNLTPARIGMLYAHGNAMVAVDMDQLIYAMAETIVDAREHDFGHDPDDSNRWDEQ
jgi:hypothetical protein